MSDEPVNGENSSTLPVGAAEPSEDRPSEHPAVIGRYRIVELLGGGSFGRVYLGFDDDLDRRVAIKVPHRERIARPEDIETYLAEARVLALLDHPGIVPVHDFGRTEDGLCYLVSKFVEGSDLAKILKEARPSHVRSAELVAAIAEALHYAHTRGVVHRDVKPGNILIDSAGKPHVADFGIALKEKDFDKGSGIAGTPSYMSPEQSSGGMHGVDGRSDIFSLGVVFYELLTGRRPFRGDTIAELLEHIATVDPRPLRQVDDTIPKKLERICHKALSKRASERYTTAKDMSDEIRHFLDRCKVDEASHGSPVVPSPEALPSSVRSNDKMRIEGTFKLGGCLIRLTVALSLIVSINHILFSPRGDKSLTRPRTLLATLKKILLGESLDNLMMIIHAIAVLGSLWFGFKLLVFLLRPVIARKTSETDEKQKQM